MKKRKKATRCLSEKAFPVPICSKRSSSVVRPGVVIVTININIITSINISKSPSPSPSPPLISTSVNHPPHHHQLHLVRFQSDLSFQDIRGTRLSHLTITTTYNNQHHHKRHLLIIIIIVTFITAIAIPTSKLPNHQHVGGVVRPRSWFTTRLVTSTSSPPSSTSSLSSKLQ